jgi:hypothetical protein
VYGFTECSASYESTWLMRFSSRPDWCSAEYTSPCPGGYHTSCADGSLAKGSCGTGASVSWQSIGVSGLVGGVGEGSGSHLEDQKRGSLTLSHLEDQWVAALVEGVDGEVVLAVLADDLDRLRVRVEAAKGAGCQRRRRSARLPQSKVSRRRHSESSWSPAGGWQRGAHLFISTSGTSTP